MGHILLWRAPVKVCVNCFLKLLGNSNDARQQKRGGDRRLWQHWCGKLRTAFGGTKSRSCLKVKRFSWMSFSENTPPLLWPSWSSFDKNSPFILIVMRRSKPSLNIIFFLGFYFLGCSLRVQWVLRIHVFCHSLSLCPLLKVAPSCSVENPLLWNDRVVATFLLTCE